MQQRPTTKEEYLKRVNIVIEYISNHVGENIDLQTLADISGFSPYHFHRIMRAFLKEPIGTFMVRLRIETAARLLRQTSLPISDIAYQVGYDMPSSLSKIFKRLYGISPNEYRTNKNFTIMKPEVINTNLNVQAEVKKEEAKQVIYIRLFGGYDTLAYEKTWDTLWKYIQQNNLFSSDIEHIGVYHDDPKVTEPDKLRTDICLSVQQPATPKGEIGVKQLRGGKYVVFTYRGSYEFLHAVYDTIYGKWIPENNYQIADAPCYEKYLTNPAVTPPEENVTAIYVPIE